MIRALKNHWPEYLMEATELGIFMISASLFTILLYYPSSPVVRVIPSGFVRRALTGLAMGLTLIGLVYSPWGKQSGAHMNPAFTLTFLRLGKVAPWDAVFYVIAQFTGGIAGIVLIIPVAAGLMAHPSINYVATLPGPTGVKAAFLAEAVISFVLVTVVLLFTNKSQTLAPWTG